MAMGQMGQNPPLPGLLYPEGPLWAWLAGCKAGLGIVLLQKTWLLTLGPGSSASSPCNLDKSPLTPKVAWQAEAWQGWVKPWM